MPFAENLGTGGGALDAQYGSSPGANTNAPLLLDPRTSGNFVYTPGSAGNYVSVPHSDSLNILGVQGTPFLSLPGVGGQYATAVPLTLNTTQPLIITASLAADDWTATAAAPFVFASQWGPLGNGWIARINQTSGVIVFTWTTDGITSLSISTTVGVPFVDGVRSWIRMTFSPSTGGLLVETSTNGTSYTTLENVTGAGATNLFNVSEPLAIGRRGDNVWHWAGKIYSLKVESASTTVFDADFTQQALGSRGFIESTGKLVSLVGNAAQIVDGTTYGTMPSTSVAAGWTVPDSAALDVSDLEITARLSLNDWTAATNQNIVSKWDNTSTSQSYLWYIGTNGRPTVNYKIGGVVQPGQDSGAAYPFIDGQTYWVRVRRIAATGVWRFYWAADSETEPTVWTNVGGDRAGTAGALDNSTALTTIGAFNNTASGYISQGRMYRAIIRNANTGGTKVLDADFTRQLQFATTFTEGSSQLATVTTVGAARIERDRDLDIQVRVALDDWTSAGQQVLAAKWHPGRYSYLFMIVPSGPNYRLFLIVDSLGTGSAGLLSWTASADLAGVVDGEPRWVRVALDVNNGANGSTATFFDSTDGVTWTVVGAPQIRTGAISIFPGTQAVELGSVDSGTVYPTAAKFYNVIIRNGINGSPVLDLDFSDAITTGSETYLPDSVDEVIPEALQYLPNLGWGGAALNARFGSAVGADTNDPLLLTHTGTNYLYLPGVAGNDASSTLPALSGNLSFIWQFQADAVSGNPFFAGTASWNIRLLAGGTVRFTRGNLIDSTVRVTDVFSGPIWIRVDHVTSTGATSHFFSLDGLNWVATGTGTSTTTGNLSAEAFTVAGLATPAFGGRVFRCIITQNAATVFDANFTTGITSGSQTTFTESSSNAATVTINRSTSGRKSVAVVQDVLLFGTDDYLEVPDNSLLDFGASDSFTVMTAVRDWSTSVTLASYASKRVRAYTPTADIGWWLGRNTTSLSGTFSDGSSLMQPTFMALTAGAFTVGTMVRNVSADTAELFRGGSAGGTVTDATTGTLANPEVLRIGRLSGAGSDYADMEFRGSAVWRRALTAAEVALVNTHYTTGPTAASTALMQQAVWWIDAGTRSVAQINRSTSGRKTVACARCIWLLGTDDFFEVPASSLFDFAQGQDYTLLVLHRGWWAQGTSDTLLATSSSTTASASGWAMSNSTGDPWEASGRHGDGSLGVTALAPRRDIGALSATWLVRDCDNDTLTAFTGSTSGTPVTDTTTGTIANTNVMRLGRLSTTGTEYLDAEVVAAVVWRRRLTAAERNAVLAYYGV